MPRALRRNGVPMIEVDGAEQSGSGTIVRYAVAFAGLLGRPLRVTNARAHRAKPGLRPQHLAAVRACAELCGAETEGLAVDARDFTFHPRARIRGGAYAWDIGTAGSATMLALGILPLACFADGPVTARITGGVFQDFAPSPHHLRHVLAPLLRRMGVAVDLVLVRAGYVPGGAGMIELRVEPARGGLAPLALAAPGTPGTVAGVAFSSHLAARRVSERMAAACEARLEAHGLHAAIARVLDETAVHAGASLAVWTETSTGALLGADRAGARGRTSEVIGRFVAESLLEDVGAGGTVDRHLADQLVLFAALAGGTSTYVTPRATAHLATNLWLAERFGATTRCEGRRVRITGIGHRSRPRGRPSRP